MKAESSLSGPICGGATEAESAWILPNETITLLVVEDSTFLRIAIERVFTRAGYRVLLARDGQEALRIAREAIPQLILLDMMLPKMTGPDVLKSIKGDVATQHIPVVVLSALPQKNEPKLIAAGAAAYFVKSDSILERNAGGLLQVVERLVGKPLETSGDGHTPALPTPV